MGFPYAILVASAADDDLANGQVLTYDLNTGIAMPQHVWKEAAIQDAALLPSQTCPLYPSYMVSTAIRTSAIHIHSLQKERPVARWYGHERLSCIVASPDGRWLVAGNENGAVLVWEVETGRMLGFHVDAHLRRVNKVAFTKDGACLVSVSEDGFCKVWSFETLVTNTIPSPLFSFSDHSKCITGLHIGYSGSSFRNGRILTSGLDGFVFLYDLSDGACLAKFTLPAPLTGCLMNATETLLLASSSSGEIYLVDIGSDAEDIQSEVASSFANTRSKYKLVNGSRSVTCMAWSFDETKLVTGDASGMVTVWNVEGRTVIRQINTASMVPGGACRWIQVVPKQALTRTQPIRTFGQLKRAPDMDTPLSFDALLSNNKPKESNPVRSPPDNHEQYMKLLEEHEKLKDVHRRLLESVKDIL